MYSMRKTVKKQTLPVLPLRGLTVFPYMEVHFDVGRDISVRALEEVMISDQKALLVTQKNAKEADPTPEDLYKVGTVAKVKQLVRLSGNTIRVRVEGLARAEIIRFVSTEPFFVAEVSEKTYTANVKNDIQVEALKRQIYKVFDEYISLNNRISPDAVSHVMMIEDPGHLADIIAANMFLKADLKQEILDVFNPISRLEVLLEILIKEIEILTIEKDINTKVRKQIDKVQREYYLREQIKTIQTELGDRDGIMAEVEEYREKIAALKLPEEVEKKALKEVDKLSKMQVGFAEGSVVRNYLDWILDLPWTTSTEEKLNIEEAQRILDEDHYGLEKVKERVLEFLAIRVYKKMLKGPIICLVGPPGVGKTSIAKSIARSLNRKYVRMSLGGVRDEAEIRGHRRTYIGAIPGRIIMALKQAETNNPLILLDEIDKMSSDFRGDPASAMLEVLDSEQNFSFRDHYIELPFDLSNVLFIMTANNVDAIPRPLLDRMEIIRISGYTTEEKLRIALDFLVPKQLEAHGAAKREIIFTEQAVRDIISFYTRESGVRTLEREIASICRKSIKNMLETGKKSIKITKKAVVTFLGPPRYRHDTMGEFNEIGVAKGLAWTSVGGEMLSIEVSVMKGNGKLELTGQLGDVMKESAKAAVSFIRSKTDKLRVEEDFYSKYDIHIHIPEGATPKDGPSAGITLATAMVSALTQRPIDKTVAMTGEITLRGRIIPIGGLKEKALAAHRAGISTVIFPVDNKKDLEEIPENVKKDIRFIPVMTMDDVLKNALLKPIEHIETQKINETRDVLINNVPKLPERDVHLEQ